MYFVGMNTETNILPQEHLFTEEDFLSLEEASTGKRFLNLIIDGIVVQYALGLLTGFVLALILYKFFPETAYSFYVERETMTFLGISYLIGLVNYTIYYTFCEKLFKGKTLGKLITGTRAVRFDGSELRWKDALLRSLVRFVPFEPFSVWFGEGLWHDRWTNTIVIRK